MEAWRRKAYAAVMAAKDPAKRRAVAASGGRARGTVATAEEISEIGRRGAAAAHSPAAQARRIVRNWPSWTPTERAEVRAILREVMPRER